jgi:hypothetical protein
MGIKDRLDLVISHLGISGRALSKQCGFSESYYATINDGIGADKLNKILSEFPEISAKWLITGKGEMLVKNEGNCAFSERFLEKFSSSFEKLNEGQLSIIGQNGEVIKINADIVRQNAELIRQHAEAMKIIQKLSEKLL